MAIAAYAGENLILQAVPNFQVDTMAELQGIIDANPATYEGKYIVVADQPAGKQVYIVSGGIPYAAIGYDVSQFKKRDGDIVYDSNGAIIAGRVVTQVFDGVVAGGDGQGTINVTKDGLVGGAAQFSSILDISVSVVQAINGNVYQRPFFAQAAVAVNLKTITCAFLTGRLVSLALTSLNAAPNGTAFKAAVTGVQA